MYMYMYIYIYVCIYTKKGIDMEARARLFAGCETHTGGDTSGGDSHVVSERAAVGAESECGVVYERSSIRGEKNGMC